MGAVASMHARRDNKDIESYFKQVEENEKERMRLHRESNNRRRAYTQELYKKGNDNSDIRRRFKKIAERLRSNAEHKDLNVAFKHVQGSLRMGITPTYISSEYTLNTQTADQCMKPNKSVWGGGGGGGGNGGVMTRCGVMTCGGMTRGSRTWCDALKSKVATDSPPPGYVPQSQCDRDWIAGIQVRCVPSWRHQ